MKWKTAFCHPIAIAITICALTAGFPQARAQTTPPPAEAPKSAVSPTPKDPAPPAAASPAPAAPLPDAGPPAVTETAPFPEKSPPDTSISQTLKLDPRPVIMLSGHSTWDDGFKTLNTAFVKLNETLAKANIHSAGNPMAVFTETDDAGFKFSAMVPIDKAPDGTPNVDPEIAFGDSPGGKVMRFQHRSAYEDIDSTYEAITAYLDEKGLEAKNLFAEEYLNRTKSPDDPSLEVDIYVFLK
jgi:effector-binding domain-containing protein